MSDKEKIKQEIESYKESMKSLWPHSDFRRGQITAYNHILQFIDSLPKEPASEDLEEAASKYVREDFHERSRADFKAGAEWQKQQMMKNAIEAEVFVDYNINFGYGSLTANIDLDEQHLKEGDNVKIIIVKEE